MPELEEPKVSKSRDVAPQTQSPVSGAVTRAGRLVHWVGHSPGDLKARRVCRTTKTRRMPPGSSKRTLTGTWSTLQCVPFGRPERRPCGAVEPMDSTLDLLTLSLLPGIGPRSARALVTRGGLAELLARPRAHADLIPAQALERLASGQARREAEQEWRRARQAGVRIVGRQEPDYPALLGQIYDPPPVLYVRGHLVAGEGVSCVAVVGSRAATPGGTALARTLARDLASAGITVISGLARGIDTAAHRGALDAGARTVAVLGSGLDRMYPQDNASLADQIVARGGAVVSEYRFAAAPRP